MSDDEMIEEQKDAEYAEEMEQHVRDREQEEAEQELRFALLEIWNKSLPDGHTLRAWESSNETYMEVFHTKTLFRELGVRGYGKLNVNTNDWRTLMECAHQYSDIYHVRVEPIMCAMAQWYLGPKN